MNEQKIEGLLAEARSALEPSQADRHRVYMKVGAAIGAAGVITTVATSVANASGSASVGIVGLLSKSSALVKMGVAALLLSGTTGLVVGLMSSRSDESLGATNRSSVNQPINRSTGRRHHRPDPAMATTSVPVDLRNEAPGSAVAPLNQAGVAPGPVAVRASAGKGSIRSRHLGKERGLDRAEQNINRNGSATDEALFKEIRLIRRSSTALRNGQPEAGMRVLEAYDREFPEGVMREERNGLRVLTLCALGRRSEAREARREFMMRSPDSPLAVRIRENCGDIGAEIGDEK